MPAVEQTVAVDNARSRVKDVLAEERPAPAGKGVVHTAVQKYAHALNAAYDAGMEAAQLSAIVHWIVRGEGSSELKDVLRDKSQHMAVLQEARCIDLAFPRVVILACLARVGIEDGDFTTSVAALDYAVACFAGVTHPVKGVVASALITDVFASVPTDCRLTDLLGVHFVFSCSLCVHARRGGHDTPLGVALRAAKLLCTLSPLLLCREAVAIVLRNASACGDDTLQLALVQTVVESADASIVLGMLAEHIVPAVRDMASASNSTIVWASLVARFFDSPETDGDDPSSLTAGAEEMGALICFDAVWAAIQTISDRCALAELCVPILRHLCLRRPFSAGRANTVLAFLAGALGTDLTGALPKCCMAVVKNMPDPIVHARDLPALFPLIDRESAVVFLTRMIRSTSTGCIPADHMAHVLRVSLIFHMAEVVEEELVERITTIDAMACALVERVANVVELLKQLHDSLQSPSLLFFAFCRAALQSKVLCDQRAEILSLLVATLDGRSVEPRLAPAAYSRHTANAAPEVTGALSMLLLDAPAVLAATCAANLGNVDLAFDILEDHCTDSRAKAQILCSVLADSANVDKVNNARLLGAIKDLQRPADRQLVAQSVLQHTLLCTLDMVLALDSYTIADDVRIVQHAIALYRESPDPRVASILSRRLDTLPECSQASDLRREWVRLSTVALYDQAHSDQASTDSEHDSVDSEVERMRNAFASFETPWTSTNV